jgi:hypothetical protein
MKGGSRIVKEMMMMIVPGEGGLIQNAFELADALMRVGMDRNALWRIIQGVWVEMFCFSAVRCRGCLQTKSLGKGGEYLSHV